MGDHIGTRIRFWRERRGISQTALAGLAGISQPYLSQLESGDRSPDSKHLQVALARALNITTVQLLGLPVESVDPVLERALVHVPAIRTALIELSAGERRRPQRDVDQLRAAVVDLTELRNAADYAQLVPALPGLLLDLAAHGDELGGLMVEALFGARFALRSMGFPDLAMQAAEIGLRAAKDHGDAVWHAQATYSLVQAYPAELADLGGRVLGRAADDLQADSSAAARQVYGCLHILHAHQDAVAGRAMDAAAHLDEAADVAASLGEPEPYATLSAGFNGNWFGPAQVTVWRMAIAAERGDTGTAKSLAAQFDLSSLPVPNRRVYWYTDYARALAAGGRDEEAMAQLDLAEVAAPQHFRANAVARSLVSSIITRAQAKGITPDMRSMARKLNLVHI